MELPVPAPERTLAQRMSALELANEIRSKRSQLKKDVTAGRTDAIAIIVDPPEWAETMPIVDLGLAIPKVGRVKLNQVLTRTRISPRKTLAGLSERQRGELAAGLSRYRPATSPVHGTA